MTSRFKVFRQFEAPELAGLIRSRHRLGHVAREVFSGDRIQDRLVRALCDARVLNAKEALESFEFHRVVRKRVRRPVMADLACGHGLTGLLFALLERSVDHVHLIDHRQPESFEQLLEITATLAPFVRDKVTYHVADLHTVPLPADAGLLGIHACGSQTDRILDRVREGPVAVMPCCYRKALDTGPAAFSPAFGRGTAIDIARSQRLDALGLRVDWDYIPESITPMNRILIGWHGDGRHSSQPC